LWTVPVVETPAPLQLRLLLLVQILRSSLSFAPFGVCRSYEGSIGPTGRNVNAPHDSPARSQLVP
jgi:hypothetical protein